MSNIIEFKAAVLREIDRPLSIETIYCDGVSYGQVLVEIYATGVCGSQLMEAKGFRGVDVWLPHLLGHEAFGKVIEIGQGVKKVKIGDEVILSWQKGTGLDVQGPNLKDCNGNMINAGPVTTFSSMTKIGRAHV